MLATQIAIGVPSSACFRIPVICSTENRFFFTTKPPSVRLDFAAELSFKLVQFYRGPSVSRKVKHDHDKAASAPGA